MPINVLPTYLVNKIAAGEVIERPASIVKEIVENALDAGANRIDVIVEDGGKKRITVTDDGSGMNGEDLALAFAPHATSKLAGEDDLFRIATMGFRGEALASIASVAHAHIRTCSREADSGYEIEASGETLGRVRPCAAAPGTTVTASDLFFNTPARRKFMRTSNTEFAHVTEQIARLSLPYPQVAFTLTHNGRKTQDLPAADSTRRRVADFFGNDLADVLIPVKKRSGQVSVTGLIAPPSASRATAKWQYFFLNGRYVRDRVLAHALREAYRGLLDQSRSPVAFIFIDMDPAEVDVNVHPTKIEVRFRDSSLVHGELLAALKETLNRAELSPSAALDVSTPADLSTGDSTSGDAASEQRRQSLREALADFFKSSPKPQPRFSFPESAERKTYPARVETSQAPHHAEAPHRASPPDEAPLRTTTTTFQVDNSYIVSAVDDGLVIVDQHALHERILYNDFRRRLANGETSSLTAQRLLIPETLDVSAAQADILDRSAELLGRLAIELVPFGPGTMAVQQFPSLLIDRGVSPGEFVREMLDVLSDQENADAERILEGVLAIMACKAAVKAGDPLTGQEMDNLLVRRDEADKAAACPHGRPTTLKLTLKDLAKQFKRT